MCVLSFIKRLQSKKWSGCIYLFKGFVTEGLESIKRVWECLKGVDFVLVLTLDTPKELLDADCVSA